MCVPKREFGNERNERNIPLPVGLASVTLSPCHLVTLSPCGGSVSLSLLDPPYNTDGSREQTPQILIPQRDNTSKINEVFP